MIRKNTLAFALAGAFAIGGAGGLHAQSEQMGMGMMSMMPCPMMMGMAEGPHAALQHADTLELTPDQIGRLESLGREIADTRQAAMERMREIHQEIAVAAVGESFDEAAARDAFAAMGGLHEELGVAMLRARHQTSRVLTAEQQEVLVGLRSDPMAMMGSMEGMGEMRAMERRSGMMDMMKNCPMMRGGMGNGSAEEGGQMRPQEEGRR